MSGYTPVFSSVLDGTLYGRWPHTGVWLCLLSQCDYRGYIDAVPALLAAKIGVSEEVLMSCISDFMAPDTGSRTGDKDGRRLELIDPSRGWGWRVINVKKYRDKASGQEQVLDGRNAAKVARYKERKQTPLDTARHHQTPTHTQTHTQTQTQRALKTLSSEKPQESAGERSQSRERLQAIREKLSEKA